MKKENGMDIEASATIETDTVYKNEREDAWEWGPITITNVPLGVFDDSPVDGHDAPVAVCIGRLAGQPLTRRICFSTRYVVETELDAREEVEVLFNNYDAIISLDGEVEHDLQQQICEAMACLNLIPDNAETWMLTVDQFTNYAKDVRKRYSSIERCDPDSIDETLMFIVFADPFESDWDSYDTWEEAVTELETITGMTAAAEVHDLYDTNEEVKKFKGFKLD